MQFANIWLRESTVDLHNLPIEIPQYTDSVFFSTAAITVVATTACSCENRSIGLLMLAAHVRKPIDPIRSYRKCNQASLFVNSHVSYTYCFSPALY